MESLVVWLRGLGLERYESVLAENEVDLEALRLLSEQNLQELGLPLGPRKKLLKAIADLNGAEKPGLRSGAAEPRPSPEPSTEGERRQLTVLFCDMVGFTELANRVDPEVLRAIIRSYEDACAVCVTRYEGYVFQRLGDGIVAFFGYPLAHEGEAERAIRAGLQIMEALSKLDVAEVGHLKVRIGIATGLVVVSSADRSAVGETMNLASRLQAIAQPGSIVVSERVHRLAGGAFDYEDMGEQTLKGISRPTHAFRILGVSEAITRFEAATHEGLTPLVGREQEIGHLAQRWQRARKGEGQVVLLSGEPGIGKSRILSALRERLGNQVGALRFQCSPYYVNSAFYPNIDNFERALKFGRDEPAASKLDKLEALVVGQFARPLADVRFIASILSLPADEHYGPLAMTPQKQKDETIRVLVDLTEAAARREPSLMLFEDAHWADPTTLEVLDLLIDRVRRVPLLIVITHRPEFEARWSGREHVTALNLSKLTRAQSSAMVSKLAGGKALPADLLEQILAKTDGVPLFVEELTKSILESTMLHDAGDRYAYSGTAGAVTIPATLRDSLMARLDRFMPVKEIAQIGAAIGREFSYELISAVAPMAQAQLDDALARLTDSGLAFRRGSPPDAVYTFKHALVQDAAYDSLLKSRRQELHGKIARVLDEQFPATKDTEPELLARHYTEASMLNLAIPYWVQAGKRALGRMALAEAIAHLERALGLIGSLPSSRQREETELDVRMALGTAWWGLKGWMSNDMVVVMRPALELARSLKRADAAVHALWGIWVYDLIIGKPAASKVWAQQLLDAAVEVGDRDLILVGHTVQMAAAYWVGDLLTGLHHRDKVLELYDEKLHWGLADQLNHDPKTLVGLYDQHWYWMLGYPDKAVRLSDEKDEHARRRNHPFDLCFALTQGAHVFDYRWEPEELLKRTREAVRIAREKGLPVFSDVMAEAFEGIALLRSGRAAESVPVLREAIRRWLATGGRLWGTYIKTVLSEALATVGELDEAFDIVSTTIEEVDRPECGEKTQYAEMLRIRGWVLSLRREPDGAESNYLASLTWAREQKAKSWELRTATSLGRLWESQGKRKEALELLAPIYGWFTEGFDTKDLKEAKALLDQFSD